MRRINIDTQLLRSLVTVADAGGFARAAEALNMTQPAMSQQMRRLEDMLQQPLFQREGRKLVFTRQGELVLGYARRILDLNDEIPARLATDGRRETIHIGIPEHFSDTFLPRVISAVYERYPDVQLVVKVGRSQALSEALNGGRLHLAIVLDQQEKVSEPPLHVAPLVWFGSGDTQLPARSELPLVLFRAPCEIRRIAIAALEKASKRWRCVHESEELAAVQAAVKVNVGVTALPAVQTYSGLRPIEEPGLLPQLPSIAVSLRRQPHWSPRTAPDLDEIIVDAWQAFRHGEGASTAIN